MVWICPEMLIHSARMKMASVGVASREIMDAQQMTMATIGLWVLFLAYASQGLLSMHASYATLDADWA